MPDRLTVVLDTNVMLAAIPSRSPYYFNLGLIETDKDDNKFVDCAFSANVQYIVTNDRHFNILKQHDFPKLNLIRIEAFAELLEAGQPTPAAT